MVYKRSGEMEKSTSPVVQEKGRLPTQILTVRQNRQLAFFGYRLISGQRPEVDHRQRRLQVSVLRKWGGTKGGSTSSSL